MLDNAIPASEMNNEFDNPFVQSNILESVTELLSLKFETIRWNSTLKMLASFLPNQRAINIALARADRHDYVNKN